MTMKYNGIVWLSIAQVAEMYNVSTEQAKESAFSVCGFAAISVTEENYQRNVAAQGEEAGGLIKAGASIIAYRDMVEMANLSEEEVEAIIGHEEGHIQLGHLEGIEVKEVKNGEVNILENHEYELAADQFGANKTSPAAMASALRKIVAFIMGSDPLKDEKIADRLAALSGE